MARKQTPPALSERQELIATLDHSRLQITQDAAQLGDALNVSRKLEASFHAYRYWWIGGGILAGLLVAKNLFTPLRKQKGGFDEKKASSERSGALFGLLGIAGRQIIRLSRPLLKRVLEKEVEQWLSNLSKARQEGIER